MMTHPRTVGVLYAGDLGASIGRLLRTQRHRVVTSTAGRSRRTARRCRAAGLEMLPTLSDVIAAADVVFSVVPPDSAVTVAEECRSAAAESGNRPTFVDLNSISPLTAREVGEIVARVGMPFVDAAVHGLASQLEQRGTLYLSGADAGEIADLFPADFRVQALSGDAGAASAFKMMLGGMSKGMVALFLEVALLAREANVLEPLLANFDFYYPGVMDVLERLVPTYPQHAARRGDELREVSETMESLGLAPAMIGQAQRTIAAVGRMDLEKNQSRPARPWTLREVVETVYRQNPLARMTDSAAVEESEDAVVSISGSLSPITAK